MTTKIARVTIVGVIVAALSGGVAHFVHPTEAASPPLPAWEKPDGTIDMSRIPATLPALDCEGNIVATLTDPFVATWTPTDSNGQSCVHLEEKGTTTVLPDTQG